MTCEKLELLSFPYEILDRVIFYLEAKDIIELLGTSRELQLLLRYSYHIITDNVNSLPRNIPKEFYTKVEDADFDKFLWMFKGTLLLEIHDIRKSSYQFRSLIDALPYGCSCKITKHLNQPLLGDSKFFDIVYRAATRKKIIKSIDLPDSISFQLHHSVWDLSLFNIPKVATLLLSDCFTTNYDHNKRVLPSLVNLYIDQKVNKIFDSIELPQNVAMFGVSSKDTIIENLSSTKLEDWRIQSSKFTAIRNCELPNLKEFRLLDSQLDQLSGFYAKNLTKLCIISKDAQLLWKNVKLDSLIHLQIACSSLSEDFEQVYCPKLETVELRLYNQPMSDTTDEDYLNPFSFLQEAQNLRVFDGCIHILESLVFEKLESLYFCGNFDYNLTTKTKTPNLQTLIIHNNSKIKQVPQLNSSDLKSVQLKACPFIQASGVRLTYPNLKYLNCEV